MTQINSTRCKTKYANLVEDVKKDETLLLADGLIKLKVVSKTKDTVACKIINGGALTENTGINLPGCKVSAPCLTQKDKKDLEFGIESGVDYFALSFVRSADDLNLLKSILKERSGKFGFHEIQYRT